MAGATFIFKRNDHWADFSVIVDDEAEKTLKQVGEVVKQAVIDNSPKDLEIFINSLSAEVKKTPGGLKVTVSSSDDPDKVLALEGGRDPGSWPNVTDIKNWADRHSIPSFLAARVIFERGIRPRRMFKYGRQQSLDQVNELMGHEFPLKVSKRL